MPKRKRFVASKRPSGSSGVRIADRRRYAHANVLFARGRLQHRHRQSRCEFEPAAGDAQTRIKHASRGCERTEGLEWIGVSLGDSNRKFDNLREYCKIAHNVSSNLFIVKFFICSLSVRDLIV